MRVVYDLRGAQSLHHPERGIARWVGNLFGALKEQGRVDPLYALISPDRPLPPTLRPDDPIATVETVHRTTPREGLTVHHIASPFELDYSLAALLPSALRQLHVVRAVTLYDVIPLVFPEAAPPWFQRRWRLRAETVRGADLVLCISEYTAEDGIRHLGLDERKVHVIGTGIPEATDVARSDDVPVDGITGEFILYTGGLEHERKNVLTLVRAFARLRADLKDCHQLVIVGRAHGSIHAQLKQIATDEGVADRLVLTGFVPDEQLHRLYSSCACFVYASTYEGFGLPIAEAMSYGAPVVCSATTSCGEVAPHPDAVFDPHDVNEIATTITRVLDDPLFASELRRCGIERCEDLTWTRVAERAVDAYEAGLAARRRSRALPGPTGALVFAAYSHPVPGTASGAFVRMASACTERTYLATPLPLSTRSGPVTAVPLDTGVMPPGQLICLVDSAYAAARATIAMSGRGGIAVAWELDELMTPTHDATLDALAQVADRVWVRDEEDAWRLRELAAGRPWPTPEILPIPPGWLPIMLGDHEGLPLEAALMLGRERSAIRDARATRLLLTVRPSRFGPFDDRELIDVVDLAIALRALGHRIRVAALGEADPDTMASAMARCNDGGAPGAITWTRWPAFQELTAWLTAADCVIDLGYGSASRRREALGLASSAGVPIVHLHGSRRHPMGRNDMTWEQRAEQVVPILTDHPPRPDQPGGGKDDPTWAFRTLLNHDTPPPQTAIPALSGTASPRLDA